MSIPVTIAKINGNLVEVVRVAEHVAFSSEKNWVLITPDVGDPERKKKNFKWIPASTRFEWIRTFIF